MATASEAFLARILDYVKTVVSPELVEPVTKATAQAIATLMNDPFFTTELRIVAELREENQWLKSQIIQMQRVIAASTGVAASRTTSTRAKRSSTSKKASKAQAPRSSPSKTSRSGRSPRMSGTASRQAKANFIKGVRQAKR